MASRRARFLSFDFTTAHEASAVCVEKNMASFAFV